MRRLNRSPLGAAAMAGTPHPIRRELTADLLDLMALSKMQWMLFQLEITFKRLRPSVQYWRAISLVWPQSSSCGLLLSLKGFV